MYDDEATCFTASFYDCLLVKGLSVQDSFYEAKQEVEIEIIKANKNKFLLLSISHIHKDNTFNIYQQSTNGSNNKLIDGSPQVPRTNCHAHHISNMVGRNQVVADVYKCIHNDERIVLVIGEAKIGKTEVFSLFYSAVLCISIYMQRD